MPQSSLIGVTAQCQEVEHGSLPVLTLNVSVSISGGFSVQQPDYTSLLPQ